MNLQIFNTAQTAGTGGNFENHTSLPGGRFRELLPKMEEQFAALSLYLTDILNSLKFQDQMTEHER